MSFMSRKLIKSSVAMVAAVAITACGHDSDIAAPRVSATQSSQYDSFQDPSKQAMSGRLTRLTRALAWSLGHNPPLRAAILDRMDQSPYPEQKLDFGALINDPALDLPGNLAKAPGQVGRAMVDSIVGLEFYLPVESHRGWNGDGDFLVASALSDNRGRIHAFDPDGRPVEASRSTPPNKPTLAIVPAETDFSSVSMRPTNVTKAMSGTGIYMTSSYLTDTHEAWVNGSPEIAIHIAKYNGTSNVSWVSCSGDAVGGDFYFDQNDNSWSGQVKLAPQSVLEDSQYEIFFWEDDWDRCDGSNNLTPNQENDYLDALVAGGKAAWEVKDLPNDNESWIEFLINSLEKAYDLAAASTNDDFVGVVWSVPGDCYAQVDGSYNFDLRLRDGTYAGNVWLSNDFAAREQCPMEVDISGPTSAGTNQYCTWGVQMAYGNAPYSYQWSGIVNGTGSTASTTVTSSGYVNVTVTDSDGRQGSDSQYVSVSSGGPSCAL